VTNDTATSRIQRALLEWYAANARDLPWRRTRDPYAIWVSEVMLQQTRVDTVIPYYDRFLEDLPTVEALAEASEERVLSLWSGLGYYRRARMLHEGAKAIAGRPFPKTALGLQQVRGMGRYTAGAVASIAFGAASPIVDGNVARVVARLFGVGDDLRKPKGIARVWSIAETILVRDQAGAWNQALMELGATVCTPRAPRCLLCPLAVECVARATGREEALPVMTRKRAPLLQRRVALAVQSGDEEVLLARRSARGIFASMWEIPSIEVGEGESGAAAAERLAVSVGVTLDRMEACGDVVHVLTHRRLEVAVLRGRLIRTRTPALHAEYTAVELMSRDEGAARTKSAYGRKLMKMGFPSTASRR
jgi:A/G-specific adenine glycosylase